MPGDFNFSFVLSNAFKEHKSAPAAQPQAGNQDGCAEYESYQTQDYYKCDVVRKEVLKPGWQIGVVVGIAEWEIKVEIKAALTELCQPGAEADDKPFAQFERSEKDCAYLFDSRADRVDYTYPG